MREENVRCWEERTEARIESRCGGVSRCFPRKLICACRICNFFEKCMVDAEIGVLGLGLGLGFF